MNPVLDASTTHNAVTCGGVVDLVPRTRARRPSAQRGQYLALHSSGRCAKSSAPPPFPIAQLGQVWPVVRMNRWALLSIGQVSSVLRIPRSRSERRSGWMMCRRCPCWRLKRNQRSAGVRVSLLQTNPCSVRALFEKTALPARPGFPLCAYWPSTLGQCPPPTVETSPGTTMSGASKTQVMRIFWPDFLA